MQVVARTLSPLLKGEGSLIDKNNKISVFRFKSKPYSLCSEARIKFGFLI